jgi:uncharacterized protein (DUF2147 family)
MSHRKAAFLLLIVMGAAAAQSWAASNDIVGVWFNQKKDAKIDVFPCGDKYCGKIVWLKEPNYPDGSKLGTPGTPKLDHYNPDAARKRVPVMGLQIMQDLQSTGDNLWGNGKTCDPDNGKTYSSKAKLVSPTDLDLRASSACHCLAARRDGRARTRSSLTETKELHDAHRGVAVHPQRCAFRRRYRRGKLILTNGLGRGLKLLG